MGATERSLPTLLRYEDRNSMAHSVEARLPFLTIPLAEFVLGLPEEYLVAPDASGKAIFRAAMRGLTPDEVLDRRDKVGFSVPIHAWISKLPILTELMEEAARLPCVDPHGLAPLMSRSNSGRSMLDVMLSHPCGTRSSTASGYGGSRDWRGGYGSSEWRSTPKAAGQPSPPSSRSTSN
jgi:asparagine synthetase B (glutamine-hydrolysing)